MSIDVREAREANLGRLSIVEVESVRMVLPSAKLIRISGVGRLTVVWEGEELRRSALRRRSESLSECDLSCVVGGKFTAKSSSIGDSTKDWERSIAELRRMPFLDEDLSVGVDIDFLTQFCCGSDADCGSVDLLKTLGRWVLAETGGALAIQVSRGLAVVA